MILFYTILILVSGANAQDLAAAGKSPFDLQKYVDHHIAVQWAPLWTALGVDSKDAELPDCEDGRAALRLCSSELITVLEPRQMIVRLESRRQEVYLRYLAGRNNTWRFDGAFSPFVKYFDPRHKFIRFGNKPFLVVTAQGAAGTGTSTEYESWIDLTRPGMKPVFGYTPSGHVSGNPPAIKLEIISSVVSLETSPVEQIRLWRTVAFSTGDGSDGIQLGSRGVSCTYRRRSDGKFTLESQASSATPAEIEEFFDGGDGPVPAEDFIRYDIDQLKKFASGHDGVEERWLKAFLKNCRSTPETRLLLSLLSPSKSSPK